jgi:hypothetical protein
MHQFLEQLINAVEQDEAMQPTRDALLENLYSALSDRRLENLGGEAFIAEGVNAYTIICGAWGTARLPSLRIPGSAG